MSVPYRFEVTATTADLRAAHDRLDAGEETGIEVTVAGRVMLHGELLSRIWGPEFRDEAHYLRTWVSRLRAKLETDPDRTGIITTFPGIGYRLEAPPTG